MAKIITFANQKGGVGKTTTSQVVSVGLSKIGKVLACDLDPQANLTSVFGVDPDGDIVSIYDVFEGNCEIADAIVKTDSGVDLLPGSLFMSGADRKYSTVGAEYKLKEGLSKISDQYDYIVIDTPPALGVMSLNALVATDVLIVTLTPDYFSSRALAQLDQTIQSVKRYLSNPTLKINGLLLTRCDRTNLTSIITDDMVSMADSLGTKIYKSKIRQAVAVRESQYLEKSIFDLKNSGVLDDYNNFIAELLEEVKA